MPSQSHSIGNVSQIEVWACLSRHGYRVFTPLGDGDQIDTVIVPPGSSRTFRIQIKTGRLKNGAIHFFTCTSNWRSMKRIQYTEIDYFAVYCPETRKSYLVPFSLEGSKTVMKLRVDAPVNNQSVGVHWAKDYEIGQVRI